MGGRASGEQYCCLDWDRVDLLHPPPLPSLQQCLTMLPIMCLTAGFIKNETIHVLSRSPLLHTHTHTHTYIYILALLQNKRATV